MNPALAFQKHRGAIEQIALRHGARLVHVFGSVARGQARDDSDLDLLVEIEERPGTWGITDLKIDLEEFLGCPVDLHTPDGIDPYIRESVLDPTKPPMPRDEFRARHILDAITLIEEFAGDDESRFFAERMRQDAIIRQLEIVGEAVNKMSLELRARHPEMPWKPIIDQRNFLIHCYPDVKLEKVWNVVTNHLPPLKTGMQQILAELTAEPDPAP